MTPTISTIARKRIFSVFFLLLFSVAHAEEESYLKNRHHLGVNSALDAFYLSNTKTKTFSGALSYGYIINEILEPNIEIGLTFTNTFDSESFVPGFRIWIPTGTEIAPFVGFNFGVSSVGIDGAARGTSGLGHFEIGFLGFINQFIAMGPTVSYTRFFGDVESNLLDFGLEFSLFF